MQRPNGSEWCELPYADPEDKRAWERDPLNRERYWQKREIRWAEQGIVLADGRPLTAAVYLAVLQFQHGRCALSGVKTLWDTMGADHDHKSGLFRGILAYAVNHHALATFERTGHWKSEALEDAMRRYLADPPYQRWLRANVKTP